MWNFGMGRAEASGMRIALWTAEFMAPKNHGPRMGIKGVLRIELPISEQSFARASHRPAAILACFHASLRRAFDPRMHW
jgi:hypothetical protein